MKSSIALIIAGVVLIVGGILVLTAPRSDAADVRPCVTTREFWPKSNVGLTREALEKRWETAGIEDPYFANVVAYKRCGYGFNRNYFGVVYNKANRVAHLLIIRPEK